MADPVKIRYWEGIFHSIGPNISAVFGYSIHNPGPGVTLLRSIVTGWMEMDAGIYAEANRGTPHWQPVLLGMYCSTDGLNDPTTLPVASPSARWLHHQLCQFSLTNVIYQKASDFSSVNPDRYFYECPINIDTPAQRAITNLAGGRIWINFDSYQVSHPGNPENDYPLRTIISTWDMRFLLERSFDTLTAAQQQLWRDTGEWEPGMTFAGTVGS